MGISRSVTLILAYLLRLNRANPDYTPTIALDALRRSRSIACPNDGFMAQLHLYKAMGCPADIDAHPKYQRWLYMRGLELAKEANMAPEYILFEDEDGGAEKKDEEEREVELRCRMCRFVHPLPISTKYFIFALYLVIYPRLHIKSTSVFAFLLLITMDPAAH